jgi:hypothetical protein
METKEILEDLGRFTGKVPQAALVAAAGLCSEITPHLLATVEEGCEHPARLEEAGAVWAHLYAMLLLAQFREPKAYPLVVRFFRLPGELALDLTGDYGLEQLPRILSGVCGDDPGPILDMAADPDVGPYVRWACFDALVWLVADGRWAREEAIASFGRLLRGGIEPTATGAWSGLVNACLDLAATELAEEIETAYDLGVVDRFSVSRKDIARAFEQSPEEALARVRADRRRLPITDVATEVSDWYCFQDKTPVRPQREVKRVGRNDPCPCGSGIKFKKCCARAKTLAQAG